MSIVRVGTAINTMYALHRALESCKLKVNTPEYNDSFRTVMGLTTALTRTMATTPGEVRAALVEMSRQALKFFRSNDFVELCGRVEYLDDYSDRAMDAVPFLRRYILHSEPLDREGGDHVLERLVSRSPFCTASSDQELLLWNGVTLTELNQYVRKHTSVSPMEYLNVDGGWSTHEDNLSTAPNANRANSCYVTDDCIYLMSKSTEAFAGGDAAVINLPAGTQSLVFSGYVECVRNIDDKEVVGAAGSVFLKNNDTNPPTLTFGGGVNQRIIVGRRVKQTVQLTNGANVTFGVAVPATAPNCFVIRLKGKFYLTPCGNTRAVTGAYFNINSPDCSDLIGAGFPLAMMRVEGNCNEVGGIIQGLDRHFTLVIESAIQKLRQRNVAYNWNYRTAGHFYEVPLFMAAFHGATQEASGLTNQQVMSVIELGRKVITMMVVFLSHHDRA